MSKYTPGPWGLERVENDSGKIVHLCPTDSENVSILTVVEQDGVQFAAVYSDADARLIAAAPEMLAALNFLNQCSLPMTSQQEECWKLVRSAIAKATGQEGGAA